MASKDGPPSLGSTCKTCQFIRLICFFTSCLIEGAIRRDVTAGDSKIGAGTKIYSLSLGITIPNPPGELGHDDDVSSIPELESTESKLTEA